MSKRIPDLPKTEVIVEVPFYDVDAMEMVWHGNYARYFEVARCALLDTIAYGYNEMKASGYAWPVIEMKTRFIKPARFRQKIKIEAKILEYELRLKIAYVITDSLSGDKLTKGHTIQVPVDLKTQEMQFGSPSVLFEKLGVRVCG